MSMDARTLPDDPAELKALLLREREQHQQVVAQYEETLQAQLRKIEQQQHEFAKLLRERYGPKQERVDPNQLMLFSSEEFQQLVAELCGKADADALDDSPASRQNKRRRGHGRRRLPQHLPRERVIYELSQQERACPDCGTVRDEIGSETSQQLEVIPAQVKIIEHVRKKYACRCCQEHVAIAEKPPQPIDKGLPGPGLLAHTVLCKYGDHLPLYRQEDILARHGVVIRRSTLCDWTAAAAELARPLWKRMHQLVLESQVIHTDDTTVKMLDPSLGRARTCRFWAYIGDASHPYSVFEFTERRSRDGPAKFLAGFDGYLQADAYGGYDGIYSGGKVLEVSCFAHCRRYWWEARATDSRRAHEGLSYIGRLYALEEQFREAKLAGDALRDARQKYAIPILDDFGQWLKAEQPQVLPKSVIGAAFRYTLNQWESLRRYTEDGVLSIDNNVAERTVKIPAIGRKNWLFVASKTGGDRAAILFSLTASCKANQLDPFAYLHSLFRELPRRAANRAGLDDLLPDRWLAQHPEHRWHIDQLRAEERKQSRQQKISRQRHKPR